MTFIGRVTSLAPLVFLLSMCHRQPQSTSFVVPQNVPATDADPVIATVNGRTILESNIRLQAKARSCSAKQALDDLITAELVAEEAERRTTRKDHEALEAAKAVAVRKYLTTVFEKEVTADTIPKQMLRRMYNANINIYDHSEFVDVWHILIPVPKKAAPEVKLAAHKIALELLPRAKSVKDEEAFKALASGVTGPGGPAKFEEIITARDGWTVKEFSYAAHDLKKKGEVSPVVDTEYGSHIIYLRGRIPAVHVPLDQAMAQLRLAFFKTFQQGEFLHFVEREMGKHKVLLFPNRLPVDEGAPL